MGDSGGFELSLEAFNLLNTANYDVRSVDNAMYFLLPEIRPNPDFGTYRDTHRPRELQIGLRWRT